MRFPIVATLAFVATGLVANAAPITSLFNTGVDASGTPLADTTLGDPHYNLVSVPWGSSTIEVRRASGGYPIPPYVGDDSLSAWIGPANDHQLDGPVGFFEFQTTFSLAGMDPLSAWITGRIATDDFLEGIVLNGHSVPTPGATFTSWTNFSIPTGSGFQAGTNTLDFVVFNTGGPTALRVEMNGNANTVPDSALPLWVEAAALGALLWFGNRRRQLAAVRS